MIAIDIANRFRDQLTEQYDIKTVASDRLEINTPFVFDDGDPYSCAIVRNGSKWLITDEGEVLNHVSYMGVDLKASGRAKRFQKAVAFYGLSEETGELVLETDIERLGESFCLFTQACFEIARLAKLPSRSSKKKPSKRQTMKEGIRNIIDTVPDAGVVTPDWHHPEFDVNKIYVADFHIGWRTPCLLFAVSTDSESLKDTTTCLHYRQRGFVFDGIAVVHEEASISAFAKIAMLDADTTIISFSDQDGIREALTAKAA
jgi:hypothetical protein